METWSYIHVTHCLIAEEETTAFLEPDRSTNQCWYTDWYELIDIGLKTLSIRSISTLWVHSTTGHAYCIAVMVWLG